MGLDSFRRGDPIFRNESILRDTYRPEQLVGRDNELEDYQDALRPIFNDAPPINLFIYGQTGVGKTAATRLILDQVKQDQERFDNLDVHSIQLNCKSRSSSYQVAVDLVNSFRAKENQIPSTGHATSQVYRMLWNHLSELDATHCLIVLDEVDSIGNDDDILYELPRANDNGNVDQPYIGVIGISNDFTFRDELSAQVKDSLCEEELHFPPYDAEQLGDILVERCDKAFKDGVLEDGVIPLSSALAAQESGSARQALKLVYNAGKLARKRDMETVTEGLVNEAKQVIDEGRVRDELEQLPQQSKLALYSILQLHEEDSTPCRRSDIYERYQVIADRADAKVMTERTIHDRLSQLRLKGFLIHEERNEGKAGGSYYLYDLDLRRELVEAALREDSSFNDMMA